MKRIKNEEEGVVICKSDDSGRIGSVDCISQLPEDIIRHILFFMPAKDAAQTSNLSKTWQQAWNSLPICTFRFDEQFLEENSLLHVGKQKETEEERERFLSHVNESLSILREKKVVVECFQLDLPLCITFYAPYIDQWISLVTRNCVQELDIHVPSYDTCLRNFVSYTLPKTTFAAKSLFTLHLTGCKLVKELFSDDTKFLCLQQLSLVNVYLEDEVVQKLLSCCPSIHTFTLHHCRKLTFLQLCNLPKLKKVNVQGFISRMQVDLPRASESNIKHLNRNATVDMQRSSQKVEAISI
ncbi:F-box family protein [Quillaja saponaria]|uniref:F-box family protein n=1 Tax=Quillaja saponaria TaxID=32244 RepID=A0AAD7L4Z1_QUISA|nr:F-box family protein [Quillaja saponaria]